jgi:hypothetical protein
MDEYLADEKAEFHSTIINENIIFREEDAEDPDWKIKQCYTLMVAVVSVMEIGVDNLLKKGRENG